MLRGSANFGGDFLEHIFCREVVFPSPACFLDYDSFYYYVFVVVLLLSHLNCEHGFICSRCGESVRAMTSCGVGSELRQLLVFLADPRLVMKKKTGTCTAF